MTVFKGSVTHHSILFPSKDLFFHPPMNGDPFSRQFFRHHPSNLITESVYRQHTIPGPNIRSTMKFSTSIAFLALSVSAAAAFNPTSTINSAVRSKAPFAQKKALVQPIGIDGQRVNNNSIVSESIKFPKLGSEDQDPHKQYSSFIIGCNLGNANWWCDILSAGIWY